jgi:sugar/nucleoside kinase (ribokinase family)
MTLPKSTASHLSPAARQIPKLRTLVGFDGFVDTIKHVVKTRHSPAKYERYSTMTEWAQRITAASGLSANFEMTTQMVKLGGNGPIMANALDAFGFRTGYIGNLGKPAIHPVFADFAQRADVISIAEPGYTDAVEFDDGKLMLGSHRSLREVNWANLIAQVPEPKLIKLVSDSTLLAMVNWTMLTELSGIFKKLLTRVMPKVKGGRRWVFFDLTDPAKRSREDLIEAVRLVAKFEKYARVILGMNLGEARQVSEVLGLGDIEETYGTVAHAASRIRDKLGVDTVCIHPVQFAAGADATGACHVVGPYCAAPVITTGAGDHFNAGFCLGRVSGLTLAESLQTGVATSGCYVRTAKSPSLPQLIRFLRTL